ncbi:AsmA family protein [Pedobacter sp. SAFR-022]|uniref:AsmA family protein n=1 Tax=Pedobacter sp. SAFR-022 TaxID=3436861 RepID=UPI003F804E83
MPNWFKTVLKTLLVLIILFIVAFISLAIYVSSNKASILASVTRELNKNLDGSLVIGSMEPTLLSGLPGISLRLNNVELKDKRWNEHKHTLLQAKDIRITVNSLALFRGAVEINKIDIADASAYLYTDSTGYTNTTVFRKKAKKPATEALSSESSTEIKKMMLKNVKLVVNNEKGNKLFQFLVTKLEGKVDYPSEGWKARLDLDVMVNSLAFNTRRGSFIKDQRLTGPFDVSFDEEKSIIRVAPNKLKIGVNDFVIGATFNTSKDPTAFAINIRANQISWRNAAALLAPNIKQRLDQFNLKNPIDVKCDIVGNMGPGGDPNISVIADVQNNVLRTPGGVVDSCSFRGMYTNNFFSGRGLSDENSAIKLYNFKGSYEKIPFTIDTAFINNFKAPVATGVVRSRFDIAKLNAIVGEELLEFNSGQADLNLTYSADLVDLMLRKPYFTGYVNIKNADVNYKPRNLRFKNTGISLKFTGPDLFISDLRLQSGKSVLLMEGSIRNFLNLYYTAPEKIVLNWNVKSPQLHLGEFLGFLNARPNVTQVKSRGKGTFGRDLNNVFNKSKVNLNLAVDKIYYKKFLATDATAQLYVSEQGIQIKNTRVKHANGSINVTGNLYQTGDATRFAIDAIVANANVKSLFYGFDNFGLQSITYKNISGNLFSKVKLNGRISNRGVLMPNSLSGLIAFNLKNGALLNFQPLINVGKFAFPLRDLNNITFSDLGGALDVRGEKINIRPMKISSSVLNLDVAGIYAMNKGTNITMDVPLRNPKKDLGSSREEQLENRMSGIVLHLVAVDGEDGKIKIKLNRNRKKDK